ncbi:hypothetical protein BDD12DRAFT_70018 [Trichophaea hybrida]|nr:hypothetical protein BDD12DRAFT_70018 [Trichophaea hybrida]
MYTSLLFATVFSILLSPVFSQSQTPDGRCGGTTKYLCTNPDFGGCCSANGWCGTTIAHCGAGCQNTYSNSTTICMAKPPSIDGTCGAPNNATCTGGDFNGKCCSKYGFCGPTASYCSILNGCQADFGAACTSP